MAWPGANDDNWGMEDDMHLLAILKRLKDRHGVTPVRFDGPCGYGFHIYCAGYTYYWEPGMDSEEELSNEGWE